MYMSGNDYELQFYGSHIYVNPTCCTIQFLLRSYSWGFWYSIRNKTYHCFYFIHLSSLKPFIESFGVTDNVEIKAWWIEILTFTNYIYLHTRISIFISYTLMKISPPQPIHAYAKIKSFIFRYMVLRIFFSVLQEILFIFCFNNLHFRLCITEVNTIVNHIIFLVFLLKHYKHKCKQI